MKAEATARLGKERWASKLGVILAVAGSAVGLGNFLRFPGQAVNNGGGAFMIPYVISFLLLGVPICWCEWTMGRLGGRFGQSSAPGIYYAIWRNPVARFMGAWGLMIPVVIFMYYVFIEAWCLAYSYLFLSGSFSTMFAEATRGLTDRAAEVQAVVSAADGRFAEVCGLRRHGQIYAGGSMLLFVAACFAINFYIIYRGVARGIEAFCKYAMPLLIACALAVLVRVLTLPNIQAGLGFMWNPKWRTLEDPQVWVAAAGQIFFSLSVGFGLILTYASYLGPNDDVVLSGLSASSMNEFCEVILGGMIIVPTAFLFLGSESARGGVFGLGFVTVPSVMYFMPAGRIFGGLWFGLLFLAAVTSSLSMLQPAIAFLEDGFGLRRRTSVAILTGVTLLGAGPIIYFNKGAIALDITDFWVGTFMIYVAATVQVIIFGWALGVDRGLAEAARGAELSIPRIFRYIIRYVTPTFLLLVFVMWAWKNAPSYIERMRPGRQAELAARQVYRQRAFEHLMRQALAESHRPLADDAGLPDRELLPAELVEQVEAQVQQLVGPGAALDPADMPAWLAGAADLADQARREARQRAVIARSIFVLLLGFLVMLTVLSEVACRGRIGRTIEATDARSTGEGPGR
ncbi:MAG: sodium-dependent transporter [Phycisphaerae bacterium]